MLCAEASYRSACLQKIMLLLLESHPLRSEWPSQSIHDLGPTLQMQDALCGLCGKPFLQEEIIQLNGTAEQMQSLKQQLDRRRAEKASKVRPKAKKRKLAAHALDT